MSQVIMSPPEPEAEAPSHDDHRPGARRRRRVPVRFIVFGVLAIAALAALGWLLSWYSPVPVREVTVTGAAPDKQGEVMSAAGIADGTPIKDIDVAGVTERVVAVPGIESVDVVLQRPFTVDLQVRQRFPFAASQTPNGWLILDQEGAAISESPTKPDTLPPVSAVDGNVRPAVAAVSALPPDVRAKVKEAVVAPDGSITITLTNGITVLWGTQGDDDLKGQSVAGLVAFKPEQINVSVPQRPALTGTLDLPKQNRWEPDAETVP